MSDNIISLGADKAARLTEETMVKVFTTSDELNRGMDYYKTIGGVLMGAGVDITSDRYQTFNSLLVAVADIHATLFRGVLRRHIPVYRVRMEDTLSEIHIGLGKGIMVTISMHPFDEVGEEQKLNELTNDPERNDIPYRPLTHCKRVLSAPGAMPSRILASVVNRFIENASVYERDEEVVLVSGGFGSKYKTYTELSILKKYYNLAFGGDNA